MNMRNARKMDSAPMYTCLLLLLQPFAVACAHGDTQCEAKSDSGLGHCAARTLLWRWAAVARQAEERADEVMQDISAVWHREQELAGELRNKLAKARAFVAQWKGEDESGVASVEKRLLDVAERYHANREHWRTKWTEAEKQAQESKEQSRLAYSDIRSGAFLLTTKHVNTRTLTYAAVSADLGAMGIKNDTCDDGGLVSQALSDLPLPLPANAKLSEWKTKTIRALDQAAVAMAARQQRCGKLIDNLDEKATGIREAINSTVEHLVVALDKYAALDAELKATHLNATDAAGRLDAAERHLITLVSKRRAKLCAVVEARERLKRELDEIEKEVVEQGETGPKLLDRATGLLGRAEASRSTVKLVANRLSALEDTLAKALGDPVPASHIHAHGQAETDFTATAQMFVRDARAAQEEQRASARMLNLAGESLAKAKVILQLWESERKPRSGAVATSECPPTTLYVSNSSMSSTLGHGFVVRSEDLLKEQEYNRTLAEYLAAVKDKLKAINEKNLWVGDALKLAEGTEARAVAQTASAVARVYRGVVEELCKSATVIHGLQERQKQLEATVVHLRHEVSRVSSRANTAWKTAQNISELPEGLKANLTNALRHAEVLGHQLTAIVAKSETVMKALEEAVQGAERRSASYFVALESFGWNADLSLIYSSPTQLCNESRSTGIKQLVEQKNSDLMSYVTAVVKLGELVATVRDASSASERGMNTLVLTAVDTTAVVEEAARNVQSLAEAVNNVKKRQSAIAFAQALEAAKGALCEAAETIHTLQVEKDKFMSTAATLKSRVSSESKIAEQAWAAKTNSYEMPQDIEEGFTYASRHVARFEEHLQRTSAPCETVVDELGEGLREVAASDVSCCTAVGSFVRDITLNLTDFSFRSLCKEVRVGDIVTSLMKGSETMLENVSAIDKLKKLAAKVEKQVKAIRRKMDEAASSAADAQAAVEEAVRRARDADAAGRCTSLYGQLLSVLQHIW
ncbi:hypothetical protein, conserved in T. vivax [Trypanosoma vivax Y486]|uniref:Uncharacterized protein n=1 Tax=Trypanosoma vivax (strain Y486) TaxID=1055687 RepID=F9WNG3_TRYVY|nr:hypothetical protein, conserved in T. vivax [Trypanosoma vivax Y486]|eukprot:CCD19081.1 hypothetical protein, conserved in T. vivax [Trypanosoma vivax Y486]